MGPASYSTDDIALLREIANAAESRLQSQLTLALAADQRALVFAGFVAAIAVAMVGGVGSLALQGRAPAFVLIGGIASVALGISMVFAVMSARPVKWFLPGSVPFAWIEDLEKKKGEPERLQELLDDFNDRIVFNDKIIQANAGLLGWAANIAAATVVLGTGAALITALIGQR